MKDFAGIGGKFREIDRSLLEGVEFHHKYKNSGVRSKVKHLMARLPFMIGAAVFCLSAFAAQAQAAHPAVAPGIRNTPARSAPSGSQPATVVATAPAAGENTNAAPGPPSAVAPTVIFRDGLLTVQTTNSSLNSVVTAIRNKTGIEFEGVEGNGGEHVALSLGPAPETTEKL